MISINHCLLIQNYIIPIFPDNKNCGFIKYIKINTLSHFLTLSVVMSFKISFSAKIC